MKTNRLLYGIMACLVCLVSSCSSEDSNSSSTAGELTSEITTDRSEIVAYQPFTLTCNYKAGHNVMDETVKWTNENGLSINGTEKDGKSSVRYSLSAGSHTFVCRISSSGNSGENVSSKSITVNVLPADVRNCKWGQSIGDVWNNSLADYKTRAKLEDKAFLANTEPDVFGAGINYTSEETIGSSTGLTSALNPDKKRGVLYRFNDENKLEKITYGTDFTNTTVTDLVRVLFVYKTYMKDDLMTRNVTYTAEPLQNYTLTAEEAAAIEQFEAGVLTKDDDQKTLTKFIKNGNTLKMAADNGTTETVIYISGNSCDIEFTPVQ